MNIKIARLFLPAAVLAGLAGTPALFAGDLGYDRYDLHRDYNQVARENRDIRADRHRIHEDLEHGRYWDAARTRDDLDRDYYERNRQRYDIRRDRRDIYRDQYWR